MAVTYLGGWASRAAMITVLCSLTFAAAAHGAPITVNDSPTAGFTTSPAAPAVGHPVTFDASASNDPDGETIANYEWTFGDGVSQTTSSPVTTHVYGASGSFTVALTVLDVKGNPSTAVTHAVKVAVDKPTARFSAKPSGVVVGKSVSLDGSASSDADDDAIVSYQWSFGDGSTQTTPVPSTGHVYGAAGTFTVTLTVVDSHGNSSSAASHAVKVNPPSPVRPLPTARFSFSPAHPVVGQSVRFDGAASNDTDGDTINSYRWSFGDASKIATAPVIGHTYSRPGTFTVRLVVVDSHGSHSRTTSEKLTVVAPPPQVARLHVRACGHRSARCHKRGLYVRFTLSARGQVVLTIKRRHHRRTLRRVVIVGRLGRNTEQIGFAHMRPGRYVLSAHPRGGAAAVTRFTWRGR